VDRPLTGVVEMTIQMSAGINERNIRNGFMQSAVVVTAAILATAALLFPVAATQSGTGSIGGLGFAAAVFLLAAWLSEAVAARFHRNGSPLVALGLTTAIRTLPPLAVCFYLAASGYNGHQHFPLIGYLFAFYFVTLVVETRFAIKRADKNSTSDSRSAH
jgi:small-conductance mechanosensitive channel